MPNAVRLARRRAFQTLSAQGQNFSPQGPTVHYEVEVYVEGVPRERDGMVLNIQDLDRLLEEVLAAFASRQVELSSAALAIELRNKLRPCMGSFDGRLIKVRLFETPDLWFDAWA